MRNLVKRGKHPFLGVEVFPYGFDNHISPFEPAIIELWCDGVQPRFRSRRGQAALRDGPLIVFTDHSHPAVQSFSRGFLNPYGDACVSESHGNTTTHSARTNHG